MGKKADEQSRKHVLPLGKPVTSAWPETNFLISLLQLKKSGWDWIINSHLQLRAAEYMNYDMGICDMRMTFYPYGMHDLTPSIYDICPFIDKYAVPRRLIKKNFDSFVHFLIEYVDEGFYISVRLNQFFRKDMGEIEYYHPAYIYGYDQEKQVIYIVDNFENGKYMIKEITFIDAELAFSMYLEEHWNSSVFLYQLHEYQYQFSSCFVADQIEDYLYPGKGVCYLNRMLCPEQVYLSDIYDNIVYFGVDCYIFLHRYIEQIISGKMQVDIRSFCLLEDHKYLMKLRYQYMLERRFIKNQSSIQIELDKLWNDSRIITASFLKGQLKEDIEAFKKIDKMLYELEEEEKGVLSIFLENIIKE